MQQITNDVLFILIRFVKSVLEWFAVC